MIKTADMSIVSLRDKRYDGVFHLVTAADGAKDFYTLENNKVRRETLAEAIELDKKNSSCMGGTSTPHGDRQFN